MTESDWKPFKVAANGGCEFFSIENGHVWFIGNSIHPLPELAKFWIKLACAVCAEWHEQQARNINPMCSSLNDSRWPQYMHYKFAIQVRKLGGWI